MAKDGEVGPSLQPFMSYDPAIARYLACLPLRYRPYFLKKRLAYIIGSVDQELRLRNEYLMTENHLPEVWRYLGGSVHIYRLQNGEYVPCERSPAFALVSTVVINQFLHQAETQDDTTFIRTWRRWVQQQVSSEPA